MFVRYLGGWIILIIFNYALHAGAIDQGERIFMIEAVHKGNLEIIRWLIDEKALVDVKDHNGKTPLMHAASKEDGHDMVKVLLEAGARLVEKDNEGATALHLTARSGSLETLKLLYNNLPLLLQNFTDNGGRTPLHEAVARGSDEIISYLLNQGEYPYFKDDKGLTPIHLAAMTGHTSLLKILPNLEYDLDEKGNVSTPLMLAALFGHQEAAEILVKAGMNISAQDINLSTPLHAAALAGNVNIIKLLIQNNATIAGRDSDNHTALYLAVVKGNFAAAKYLVDEGLREDIMDIQGNTLLHAAASSGNLELVELFFNKSLSMDINKTNNNGTTPLLLAAQKGHLSIVSLLLNLGAKVDIVDKNGSSLVIAAASSGNLSFFKAVTTLPYPLIYDVKDLHSATPLHYLSRFSDKIMIDYVIDHVIAEKQNDKNHCNETRAKRATQFKLKSRPSCYKQIVNRQDVNGKTPSYYAAESGNIDALEMLLRYGGNLNIFDNKRRSPLHAAAHKGQNSNVLNFLSLHMNLDAKDSSGKTALFLSAEEGHLDTLRHLINIGADVFIKNNEGRTIMHAAAANGWTDVVLELSEYKNLLNSEDIMETTPARLALDGNHLQTFSVLKELNANINPELDIFQAVKNGQWNSAKYLFSECTSPFVRDAKGRTLMHVAASMGQTPVIKELSKHKCLVNILDYEYKSPAWYALQSGNIDSFKLLQQLGGTIDSQAIQYLLFKAISDGRLDIVKYFIDEDYDVNTKNEFDESLIIKAIKSGRIDIVQYLIEAGARFNDPDVFKTAVVYKKCEIVNLLLEKGVKFTFMGRHNLKTIPNNFNCLDISDYYYNSDPTDYEYDE